MVSIDSKGARIGLGPKETGFFVRALLPITIPKGRARSLLATDELTERVEEVWGEVYDRLEGAIFPHRCLEVYNSKADAPDLKFPGAIENGWLVLWVVLAANVPQGNFLRANGEVAQTAEEARLLMLGYAKIRSNFQKTGRMVTPTLYNTLIQWGLMEEKSNVLVFDKQAFLLDGSRDLSDRMGKVLFELESQGRNF